MTNDEVRCPICGQVEDAELAAEVAVMSRLVGWVPYGICVRCGLEVMENKDLAYRARANRYRGSLLS